MNTTSSHLTLEELTAYVNEGDLTPPARAHMATCAACQAEARNWHAIADGLELLLRQPPPHTIAQTLATIDAPSRRRRPAARTVALASAAAAAVVIGVPSYLVSTSGGTAEDGTNPSTVLMAAVTDTDCKDVKVTAGTLQSTSGSTLTLRTAAGQTVTATTTSSTKITRQVTGTPADVTTGSHVIVRGKRTSSAKDITADTVALFREPANPPKLPRNLPNLDQRMAENGNASGTVTEVHDGGFTVDVGSFDVKITTSPSTTVTKQVDATVNQLANNEFTVVVGTPAKDGTLTATTVQQQQPLRIVHPPKALPTPPRSLRAPGDLPELPRHPPRPFNRDLFKGLGCDPAALTTTAFFSTTN